MPSTINPQPSTIWEQLPTESAKAFEAFTVYLSLRPPRSIHAVGTRLSKDNRILYRWSKRFDWPTRAASHDAHIALSDSDSPPISHLPSTISSPPLPSPLSSLPSPWERLPTESDKAFTSFTAYLALGPERSINKAAKAIGRAKDQLGRWSAKYHWPARAAAYHAHLAAIERHATEELVAAKSHDWVKMHETVRREAWAEAEDLITLARDFKARWRDSDRLPGFDAIIRALDLAFRLKQFAAGMPSEIKEVNTTHTGPDGGPIMVQFEAAVRKIYGQPAEVVDVKELPAPSAPSQPSNP